MSRLGMSMAMMAAMMAMGGGEIGPPLPRHDRQPEPPKIKSAGNPAGSKYRNRKLKKKRLFNI